METESLESLGVRAQSPVALTNSEQLVIVGGGTMGQGIAETAARRGLDVLLIERDDVSLKRALDAIAETLSKEIEKWALTAAEKKSILAHIKGSTDFNDISDQVFIIEAIPESLESKQGIFRHLDGGIHPDAILITNTSTLSITELAAATSRPERVIGIHFLSPVPKIKVVEIVRGVHTSNQTYQKALTLADRLERTAIEVFESPGYVTTRVIIPMMNEAIHVLMEGVASAEDIDTALRLGYDLSNGPLAMADKIGLDTVLTWQETLFHDLGDQKYRPCPLLKMLVRAGLLGMKTSQGFFKYDEEGRIIPGSGLTTTALDRYLAVRKQL
jgi:3-hydroxybutyryl-CoA dehydrogenase